MRHHANPVGKLSPPKHPVDPEGIFGRVQPRVYTPKQLGQLLAHAHSDNRAVLLALAGTGLRAGELCGLLGVRIDLRRRRLEVVTVRYHGGRFGRGYKRRLKSMAGIRSIPLAGLVVEELQRRCRRNGPRSCSPMRPATASGTPSRPGWRTTASRPG